MNDQKTNLTVRRAVDVAMNRAVRRAVYWAMGGAVNHASGVAVNHASGVAVNRAVVEDPSHPGLQDFLCSCGPRTEGYV